MDNTDFDAFADRLTVLAEHWDRSLSSAQLVMDFEALADLSRESVFAAITRALQESTFWPSIAELRRLALGTADLELAIERAWLTYKHLAASIGGYQSVTIADPALADTLVAMFGSWEQACWAELTPEMWAATRKEFGRVYRVMVEKGEMAPKRLDGFCDRDNRLRGYPTVDSTADRAAIDGTTRRALPAATDVSANTWLAQRRLADEAQRARWRANVERAIAQFHDTKADTVQ